MMRGSLRGAVALSAALHAALLLVPATWWDEVPGGDPLRGGRTFTVSLFESAPDGDPAAEAVPAEPEPEAEAEPVAAEPALPEPAPVEAPVPAETPPAGADGSRGRSAGGVPGESGAGAEEGAETGAGKASFRAPRPLSVALPIDPENPGDLEVPPEIPVRLWIGTDGSVLRVVPQIEGLPAPVQTALEESARNMRFIPASRGGTPVEAWFSMTFVFRD